jgi:hypothetical protein
MRHLPALIRGCAIVPAVPRLRRVYGYVSNLSHFAGLGAPRVPPEIEVSLISKGLRRSTRQAQASWIES